MYFRNVLRLLAVLAITISASAQRPQDNWYLESTWAKSGTVYAATNGGLSAPYGVAIGPDGRIYVGDQGYGCIQVYQPDGTYSFSITNGFGGGLKFSKPRGLITDKSGNLYVADYGTNCVFEFTAGGTFVQKFGNGTGSANGQLSNAIDVAISSTGQVYVLEKGNDRVSVFNPDGSFAKIVIDSGSLDGQLDQPNSIAVGPNGNMYIVDNAYLKVFTQEGIFLFENYYYSTGKICNVDCTSSSILFYYPYSVRVDMSGLVHLMVCWSGGFQNGLESNWYWPNYARTAEWHILKSDGSLIGTNKISFGVGRANQLNWPFHAVGTDGTMVMCGNSTKSLELYRYALRDQWAPPRNAVAMPGLIAIRQRANSSLVDIDYHVMDQNDATVQVAALVFKNGIQTISNCVRNLSLVEGTITNIGAGITANEPHRITWNAATDWSVNLGDYRVAILAKDGRTNLLDIHYLHLPAGNGMPALTISRSPLIQNDFMQVWWWQLATGDTNIGLSAARIVGVGGAYDGQILCDNTNTTTLGRSYVYGKMNVREATAVEVKWAREAALPDNTNRWASALNVGGRPKSVNEYGFDTGDWGTNAFWVVPQN